jgi:hypothetical protein
LGSTCSVAGTCVSVSGSFEELCWQFRYCNGFGSGQRLTRLMRVVLIWLFRGPQVLSWVLQQ